MNASDDTARGRWRRANPHGYAMHALRVRHYLSVDQLATALGVHRGSVIVWERGSKPVPPRIVERVRRLALQLAPRSSTRGPAFATP